MRSISNCNVMVTGSCGFLGSHLVDHLINDRNCEVVAVDNLVAGHREYLHSKAVFEHRDITGPEDDLRKLMQEYNVRYVFNYASHPYVPMSYKRPLEVFNVNAFAALKVINAAHEAGCEGILQVSSAEIYGNMSGSIKETDQVEPHSSYGTSKAAIDAMVQVRWRESKTKCISLRQFNCYGPRPTHRYVIPEIIHQLFSTEDGTIHLGNNSQRDFQYATDAVKMAVELLEKGEFGEVYNMGSQESIHIYTLAQMLSNIIGCGRIVIKEDQSRVRKWEIWQLKSCNDKLYSVIDTRPEVSFEDGLRATVEYYKSVGRKWKWSRG